MVGKSFPRAVRLAQTALGNWDVLDGTFYSRTGQSLIKVPHHHLLNIVYVWARERIPDDEAVAWETELDRTLPGAGAEDPNFDDSYNQINQQ